MIILCTECYYYKKYLPNLRKAAENDYMDL